MINKTKFNPPKELNLGKTKAYVDVKPVKLVSLGDVELMDETRLYFEVNLSIGLTLFGLSVSDSSYFNPSIIFLAASLLFLAKYVMKKRALYKNLQSV